MSLLPAISLFGHRLANCDRTTVLADMLNREQKATYAFVNAHCVNVAAHDRDYNAALRAADALLPDGIGIAIAARMSRQMLRENLNGTDLFLPLCEALAAQGKSVFFLGARPGVAEQAARNAQEIVPGLKVAGTRHGFFTASENDDVVSEINAAPPDVLLVAMGVGALFDFYAGEVQRAPKALRKAGLEWAWRLAMEPRRMARRYLFVNPTFLMRAVENAWSASPSVPNPMPISKRILDITIASAALFAFSPVLLGTAVAVKAESPGPVFFRQTRVGLNGKTF